VTIINSCALLFLAAIVLSFSYLSWHRSHQKVPVCDGQRICPHCGRITARTQAACLECGKEPML
jgi:hypothetical protein